MPLCVAEDTESFSHCSALPESVGFGLTKEKVDEEIQSVNSEDYADPSNVGKRKVFRELFPEKNKKGG